MNTEQWQTIPGWEGLYEASDQGNVRSLDRTMKKLCGRTRALSLCVYKGRTLKPQIMRKHNNRRRFRLYQAADGSVVRNEWVLAARLVWRAFIGEIPDGLTVDHKNENPTDDRLLNLQLLTPFDNTSKSHKENGESRRGENHSNAKLKQDWVDNIIRPALANGCSNSEISRVFGVFTTTIDAIANGKTWKGKV